MWFVVEGWSLTGRIAKGLQMDEDNGTGFVEDYSGNCPLTVEEGMDGEAVFASDQIIKKGA